MDSYVCERFLREHRSKVIELNDLPYRWDIISRVREGERKVKRGLDREYCSKTKVLWGRRRREGLKRTLGSWYIDDVKGPRL